MQTDERASDETRGDELLTVAETAQRLRASARQVQRLVASGELRCVRIGRRLLIRADDLRAYIEAHRQ